MEMGEVSVELPSEKLTQCALAPKTTNLVGSDFWGVRRPKIRSDPVRAALGPDNDEIVGVWSYEIITTKVNSVTFQCHAPRLKSRRAC